ncbi:restriction endonuclease subunit S [Providencia rettgeri]
MKLFSFHSSWSKSSLEDIAIHIIGGDWGKDPEFSEEEYKSVSCIRGSEFKNWKKNFGSTAVIRKVKVSSLTSRKLLKNDILVEISGGGPDQPVGRTVLIDDRVLNNQTLPLVCTNFIRLVRLSPEVSASFINRYLEFFYSSGEVTKYQGGSNNLRNLKFKEYSKIEIPLPSLAEQKIIAEKLDTLLAQVDITKARLEQILQILKRFLQAVLAAAVSGKLTHKTKKNSPWQEVLLNNIASHIVDCPHSTPKWSSSGKYCVRTTAFNPFKLDLSGQGFVDEATYQNRIQRLKPKEDDILYSREGTIGIACQIPKGVELCLGQRMVLIRASDKILSKYLTIVLNSNKILTIVRSKTMGSTVPRINMSDIKSYPIPLPSLSEQHEIVRRVEQLFAYADTIEKQVNNALVRVNNLTQSILAKAFRGELTAQWRAENPDLISGENSAAVLLEKIKAERAASGSKKVSRKKK